MVKSIFIFILGLFCLNQAFAQKDTSIYYLSAKGKVVATKESADYFLLLLPPDTSVDRIIKLSPSWLPGIQKDIGCGCGEEAVRVIKSFPLWKPAKKYDKPVWYHL